MKLITYEMEVWNDRLIRLIEEYGNARATEAYHGVLHCVKTPRELMREIKEKIEMRQMGE